MDNLLLLLESFAVYTGVGLLRLYIIFAVGFELKLDSNKFISKISRMLFYMYDVFLNWCISLFLWDWPEYNDETITQRLLRYQIDYAEDHWRSESAVWVCKKLNKHDKNHC